VRAAVVVGVLAAAMAGAGPALAQPANGAGPGLTVSQTIGIFVGIPLLAIVVITSVVYALTGRTQARYRRGAGWTAAPQWWNGPLEDDAADHTAAAVAAEPAAPSVGTGGARAQW
jgi:hypothetical protein